MSFRIKAAQNRGLACRHPNCNVGRASVSPFCDRHAKAVERFGHPDGRALSPKRDYGVERELVASFLRKHSDHAGVVSALKWLEKWLEAAAVGEDVPGRQEMQRLQANAVSPVLILTEAAALFLLSRWRPRTLPDDLRLDFAIGYRVLCLAPRSRRYSVSRGKPRMVSLTIGKVPRREVGRRIRLILGPLLMNIAAAIIAEDTTRKQLDVDLRQPFNLSSSSTS